jgi:hypothetical protein
VNDCDDRRPTTGDAFHTSPLCVVRRLTVRLGTQSVLLSVEFLEATEPLQKEADRNPEHVRTAVRHAKTAGAAAWTFHARQVFSLTTTCLRARIQADTVERAAGLTCAATGVTCMGTRTAGTVVTLAAAREPDKVFTGWGNACTGTTPCTVTADAARLVVATFSPTPHLHTAYYHLDAYGSVRAVTDEAGAVLRRHDYFPFRSPAPIRGGSPAMTATRRPASTTSKRAPTVAAPDASPLWIRLWTRKRRSSIRNDGIDMPTRATTRRDTLIPTAQIRWSSWPWGVMDGL